MCMYMGLRVGKGGDEACIQIVKFSLYHIHSRTSLEVQEILSHTRSRTWTLASHVRSVEPFSVQHLSDCSNSTHCQPGQASLACHAGQASLACHAILSCQLGHHRDWCSRLSAGFQQFCHCGCGIHCAGWQLQGDAPVRQIQMNNHWRHSCVCHSLVIMGLCLSLS